jgi:hypothetical protein
MIETLGDLKRHLEAAVQLELSVIPPYLCALYTLQPGANEEVSQIIRSVVVEEMLHMILAANVLNAVDGRLRMTDPGFVPTYPTYLPDGNESFLVHLLPFSPEAVETFLKIEEPSYEPPPAAMESLAKTAAAKPPVPLRLAELGPYETVGDFYKAIIKGIEHLVDKLGEREVFQGNPERQIPPEIYYYAGGGQPIAVHDLRSAKAAMEQIVDQGEGETCSMYDGDGDLAHYFRFMEIKYGRRYEPGQRQGLALSLSEVPRGEPFPVSYEAVYPMLRDPRTGDYPAGELRQASLAVDAAYSHLIRQLQSAFDGRKDLLLPAVGTMFELKYKALELLKNPLPGQPGVNAGPAFEYVP